MKKIIIAGCLLTLTLIAAVIYHESNVGNNTLRYLIDYTDSTGYFVDYTGTVNCSGINDIGYRQWKDGVIITVGKIDIYLRENELKNKANLEMLKFLHLTLTKDANSKYHVYYDGTKVSEYVN